MAPPAPSVVYCTPSDVYDYSSSEGVQLRLDDHENASGQTITVTSTALAGATSIPVLPLLVPLMPGTVLVFDGGNMPATLEVTLTALARVGDTALTTAPLGAQVNNLATAFDSGVNVALAARLLKSCYYGTGQVNLYCQSRYDPPQLALSWSVNRWAVALAGRWLGRRRGQSAPKSVDADCKEALEEMKMVRTSMLNIEDIGTRTSGFPFISNTIVDLAYSYRKIRVEQPLSELTPTQYPQAVDWNSAFLLEF